MLTHHIDCMHVAHAIDSYEDRGIFALTFMKQRILICKIVCDWATYPMFSCCIKIHWNWNCQRWTSFYSHRRQSWVYGYEEVVTDPFGKWLLFRSDLRSWKPVSICNAEANIYLKISSKNANVIIITAMNLSPVADISVIQSVVACANEQCNVMLM